MDLGITCLGAIGKESSQLIWSFMTRSEPARTLMALQSLTLVQWQVARGTQRFVRTFQVSAQFHLLAGGELAHVTRERSMHLFPVIVHCLLGLAYKPTKVTENLFLRARLGWNKAPMLRLMILEVSWRAGDVVAFVAGQELVHLVLAVLHLKHQPSINWRCPLLACE